MRKEGRREGKWDERDIRCPSQQRRARKSKSKAASAMAPWQDTEPTFKEGTSDKDSLRPNLTWQDLLQLCCLVTDGHGLYPDTNLDISGIKRLH